MPRAERLYRTQGIILRRQDLGEADRILTLYTRDHGKIKVVGKGVRRPTSRKAGHVELFVQVDALIARGRSLDVLSQVEMVNAFLPIRDDLEKTTYASHFVELLDAFTEEGDENRLLFDLLREGLGWLCATGDLDRTARYYELHILELAGYRPELFKCVICGEEIQPVDQFFSPFDGGVICPSCAKDLPRARALSLRALKVLRYMQRQPYAVIEELQLSPGVQIELERILHDTLVYFLERRLKSAAFLRRLRREAR